MEWNEQDWTRVVNLVEQAGTPVFESKNWKTLEASSSPWHPVGIMIHHSVGVPLTVTLARGANRFGGPLCNFIVRRNSRQVDAVSGGYAFDSGPGNSQVLEDVKSKASITWKTAKERNLWNNDTNGNPWFIDIEVEHPGDGTPLAPHTRKALIDLVAALVVVGGFHTNQIIGHSSWTTRKIDPNFGLGIVELRSLVRERVGRAPTPPDVSPVEPVPEDGRIRLAGPPTVSVLRMQQWARARGATDRFLEMAPVCWEESVRIGVDPALTWVIMGHETGMGHFGKVVPPDFHNWGGIKTSQGGGNHDTSAHARFSSDRIGVRAVAQHVALYAGIVVPSDEVVDPRHFASVLGHSPTIPSDDWTWASDGPGHSRRIAAKVEDLRG